MAAASEDLSFDDMKAEFISMDQEIKEKVYNKVELV